MKKITSVYFTDKLFSLVLSISGGAIRLMTRGT